MQSTQYQFERSGKLKPLTGEELAELDHKGTAIIVCSQGTNEDGRPYWLYIAVTPSKYRDFMRLSHTHAHIVFADFGTILKYGYDEKIPSSARREMMEEYGYDEHYMRMLEQQIEKERSTFLKEEDAKDTARFKDLAAQLKQKQSPN